MPQENFEEIKDPIEIQIMEHIKKLSVLAKT
jgi:hypothetical protein